MNTAIDPDHVAEVYAKLSVRREGEGKRLSGGCPNIDQTAVLLFFTPCRFFSLIELTDSMTDWAS